MKNILNIKLFFFMALAMEGCDDCPESVSDFPEFLTGETVETRGGGFKGYILEKCDCEPWDACSTTDDPTKTLEDLIQSGCAMVRYDCEILGDKPAASQTKKKLGSCGVEKVTNRSHTVNITDYKNDELNSADVFYQHLQKNYNRYRVSLIDCDDRVYQYGIVNINPNRVHEADNKDGNTFWSLELTWDNLCDVIPCSNVDFTAITTNTALPTA